MGRRKWMSWWSMAEARGLRARLLAELRPDYRGIAGLCLLSFFAAPLALLAPVPLKIAVDCVIGAEPLPALLEPLVPGGILESPALTLAFAAGLLIAVSLLTELQGLSFTLLRADLSERMLQRFRSRLFDRMQRLSLAFHDEKGTSDSAYRVQYDAASLQHIAVDGVIPFLSASLMLGLLVYTTFQLDPTLALIAIGITPILFLVTRTFRPKLRRQAHEVKELESSSFSVVREVLAALRVVKAFGQEDRERERFHAREGLRRSARIRLVLSEGALGLSVGLVTATGTAMVLLIGVRHVQAGALTLGELLLVMSYLTQLYGPLRTISKRVASLQSHLASLERAFAVLDEDPEVFEAERPVPLEQARGEVTFHDVTYSYRDGLPALSGVSFHVPAGTRTGVAGRTGSGKSTLLGLLTRFHDPDSGAILLDGVDLREFRLADLRRQFAIVLQEPVLFATSIAENISYARPQATRAQIEQAARAANAHDFIVDLPEGYDTAVGERGLMLSGGERQRIALARAFLKDAPILLMDEPTSSVDVATERGILEAMERLMDGRTTFLVAHRLDTLEQCELLLVLEQGHLVEKSIEPRKTLRQLAANASVRSSARQEVDSRV